MRSSAAKETERHNASPTRTQPMWAERRFPRAIHGDADRFPGPRTWHRESTADNSWANRATAYEHNSAPTRRKIDHVDSRSATKSDANCPTHRIGLPWTLGNPAVDIPPIKIGAHEKLRSAGALFDTRDRDFHFESPQHQILSDTETSEDGDTAQANHGSSIAGANRVLPQRSSQRDALPRQRYMNYVERYSIIQRIDHGEKQADLAREFGVTRGAICHIKRNRAKITSRYQTMLKSIKAVVHDLPELVTKGADRARVRMLSSASVRLLLTKLRDASTPHSVFRPSADRLMMVMLEEVVASATTTPCQVRTVGHEVMDGVELDPSTVVLAVGPKGKPLLQLFRDMEPTRSTGVVHLRSSRGSDTNDVIMDRVDIAREISHQSTVILVSTTSASGRTICAAIDGLVDLGIPLNKIRVALMVCTTNAVSRIQGRFKDISILTTEVEERISALTTLGDFVRRYYGAIGESTSRSAVFEGIVRDQYTPHREGDQPDRVSRKRSADTHWPEPPPPSQPTWTEDEAYSSRAWSDAFRFGRRW